MINKYNYIEYIVDYYDNNLSYNDKEELLLFIEKYPEIKKEFLEYGSIYATNITTSTFYEGKNNLLKSENDEFEQKCIDYIEGNISKSELLIIAKNNPKKLTAIKLYEKTKLKIPIIKYPHKKLLYHYNTLIYLQKITQIAVAATIIGLSYFLFFTNPISKTYIPRKTDYISENKTMKLHKNKILEKNINSIQKKEIKYQNYTNKKIKTEQNANVVNHAEIINTMPVKKIEKVEPINIDIIQISYHKPNLAYNTNILQEKYKQTSSNNLLKRTLLQTVEYLFRKNIEIQKQPYKYFAFNSNNINIKIVKK